ncbi:MAG: hypothetical protein GY749_22730 [Desulfobacteraceae bacterium]|nr:hypothetical protein [Desulfobacteraceae bacterium]
MCLSFLFKAQGIQQQYSAQARTDRLAAGEKDKQSNLERTRVGIETKRESDNADRLAGRQIASFAENGIAIDGTVLDYIEDSAIEADKDVALIRQGSKIKRDNLAFEAGQLRQRAKNTKKASKYAIFDAAMSEATKMIGAF